MDDSAIGLVELNSIATGVLTLDTMMKRAAVKLIDAFPVCPGKFIILICGEVGAVRDSVKAGVAVGKEQVIGDIVIPQIDPAVITAIGGTTPVESLEAVNVFETFSIAACVLAADAAVKTAAVTLIEVRLAKGLGGKSFFSMTGSLSDIRSAEKAARAEVADEGTVFSSVIIPSPHADVARALL
jgi:microcompartment protein CcmL/EutN